MSGPLSTSRARSTPRASPRHGLHAGEGRRAALRLRPVQHGLADGIRRLELLRAPGRSGRSRGGAGLVGPRDGRPRRAPHRLSRRTQHRRLSRPLRSVHRTPSDGPPVRRHRRAGWDKLSIGVEMDNYWVLGSGLRLAPAASAERAVPGRDGARQLAACDQELHRARLHCALLDRS